MNNNKTEEVGDDDVSDESVAEFKIIKIDRRLRRNKESIDNISKRRL